MKNWYNILESVTFLVFVDIPFSLGAKQLLIEFGLPGATVTIVSFLLVILINLKISCMWKY